MVSIRKLLLNTSSAAQTMALAEKLARGLRGGEIIFLSGPIGAGKTVFVQGLAGALGMKRRPASASFGLMREYRSRRARLFHLDLFRLDDGDMANFGFEEILARPEAIIAVEWPGPLAKLLSADRLELDIKLLKGDARALSCKAGGPVSSRLLAQLRNA